MKIILKNKTFDGKWQWLYFLILDVNDFFGCPIRFVIDKGNMFQNFDVNWTNWNKKSTKFYIVKWAIAEIERRKIIELRARGF